MGAIAAGPVLGRPIGGTEVIVATGWLWGRGGGSGKDVARCVCCHLADQNQLFPTRG